jgi:hypothetical protein
MWRGEGIGVTNLDLGIDIASFLAEDDQVGYLCGCEQLGQNLVEGAYLLGIRPCGATGSSLVGRLLFSVRHGDGICC